MQNQSKWLTNLEDDWRDVNCTCGSKFHFDGEIDDLLYWERTHIPHMRDDCDNHDMISFYPNDMVIFYHSKSGYVVERRKHRSIEIQNLFSIRNDIKLIGV